MEQKEQNSKRRIQYSDNLEDLISMAVADGKTSEKEKRALLRRAIEEGIDPDEFEMVLESRLRDVSVEATDNGEVLDMMGRRSIMSSEKLANLLMKEESAKKRVNIIKDFPIPSTAEDLLEFIVTMSSRAKSQGKTEKDGGDGFMEKRAYVAKYDEACIKAKTFFSGDSRFASLMENAALKKKDRRTEKTFWEKHKGVIIIEVILGILAIVLAPVNFIDAPDGTLSLLIGMIMLCVLMSGTMSNGDKNDKG